MSEIFLLRLKTCLSQAIKGNKVLDNFNCKLVDLKILISKRYSLDIEIYDKKIAHQKLNYIHFNPVSGKWKLSKNDLDYYYSSARFYETGIDEFGFLKNLFEHI